MTSLLATSFPAPDASLLVTWGIGGIAFVMACLFLLALVRATGRPVVSVASVACWLGLWGAVAASGLVANADAPYRPVLIFIGTFAMGLTLGLSPIGRRISEGSPLWALVAFQAFRLPLELVMHVAADEGTMPKSMSFSQGYNFDVVTGASAIVVALLLARGASRRLAWAWNVLGSALLLTVVVVAFLGSPMVRFFGDDQVNTWVAFFPFIWLPTVLVALALAGHVVVFRKLLRPEEVIDEPSLPAEPAQS